MNRDRFKPLLGRVYRGASSAVDTSRATLDNLSNSAYQTGNSRFAGHTRPSGTQDRWEAIRAACASLDVDTVVDIGCNEGYFAHQFLETGAAVVGVDSEPKNVRLLLRGCPDGSRDRAGALQMTISPETVGLLPQGSCVLFLAVWHHLVRAYGLDRSCEMLSDIWQRTGSILLFETGESEMPDYYGLPDFRPDAETYITALLGKYCPGGKIEHLGRFAAFDAEGVPCTRSLFAAKRGA